MIPELLAPCGEYKTSIGAFNAGADAVYLGADMFSARAYAKNLTKEEIIDVINYAHLFNKKVYLALNILLKNVEFKDALKVIEPLYVNGLDGIIVQDLGLLNVIPKVFPQLNIHASTQMSIMSKSGIDFLKEHNVSRVVPSRELSLNEIRVLKSAGLEIECFIHGAMCYSYSGKCLMSSMAGGRSGNRGRCAGTCRKKYSVYEKCDNSDICILKDSYPISMKDMCTINYIGLLIDAGVDSFKIEGRMKNPEYAAGVCEIYRKYIDLYLKNKNIKIENKDIEFLSNLYIRSDICNGYMNTYNDKNMITINSPSYRSIEPGIAKSIQDKYINKTMKIPVKITSYVYAGKKLEIIVEALGNEYFYEGDIVTNAQNRPLNEEDIRKQLSKLGNTNYEATEINVFTDNNSFLPLSSINNARREAFAKIDESLKNNKQYTFNEFNELEEKKHYSLDNEIIIGVKSLTQLDTALKFDFYDGIIIDLYMYDDVNLLYEKCCMFRQLGKKVYIRLPEVIREIYFDKIDLKLNEIMKKFSPDGLYAGGFDAVSLAYKYKKVTKIIGDYGLYVFNIYSEDFILSLLDGYTASFENNSKELNHFNHLDKRQIIAYGYVPVMYSANCLLKTTKGCNKKYGKNLIIKDENKREFRILLNHTLCYNTIYNIAPLNLLEEVYSKKDCNAAFRFEFSVEDENETYNVLATIQRYILTKENGFNQNSFTKGHYRRGVE